MEGPEPIPRTIKEALSAVKVLYEYHECQDDTSTTQLRFLEILMRQLAIKHTESAVQGTLDNWFM